MLALDIFLPLRAATNKLSTSQLHTLLLCLCAAQRQGVFEESHKANKGTDEMWKGVLPFEFLLQCTAYSSEEVPLQVLALMVEVRRSTQMPLDDELHVVRCALENLSGTQIAATRQRTLALLCRLLRRIEASAADKSLSTTRDFINWLCNFALQPHRAGLFPAANHGRRAFLLQVLVLMLKELKEENLNGLWTPTNAQILFEVLRDPYEDNKVSALFILERFPVSTLGLQDQNVTSRLMEICVSLSQSIRPTDTTTAAYLLQLLLSYPWEQSVWISLKTIHHQLNSNISVQDIVLGDKPALQLEAVQTFELLLKKQVNLAKDNVMAAAFKAPMYGTLLCLHQLMEKCDLRQMNTEWEQCVSNLLDTAYEAVAAVEHIVNSSSPEGHLPMDGQLFAEVTNEEGEMVPWEGQSVRAQQLLLCAWRTVKEASLLMGTLATQISLTDIQLRRMGQHFIRLLAEVKHRGAFEQVYVGFTQLCSKLWSFGKNAVLHAGSDVALYELPSVWLKELLLLVSNAGSSKVGTALCVTRRSAGVPFLIQALLATEPVSAMGETSVLPQCMASLLQMARQKDHLESQIHSLNILRAIFRCASLVERVSPFIAEAVKIAGSNCHRRNWSARNASTLLFATLMTRLFGVPLANEHQRIRRMSGQVFFHQYPTLYDFLLDELTPPKLTSSSESFEPFPALLLLSRLNPSSPSGFDSKFQLSNLMSLVHACAGQNTEQMRALAARALIPLVCATEWPHLVTFLMITVSAPSLSWNMHHGLLLQVVSLIQTASAHFGPDEILKNIGTLGWLEQSVWLLSLPLDKCGNFSVAGTYVQVLQEIVKTIIEGTVSQITFDNIADHGGDLEKFSTAVLKNFAKHGELRVWQKIYSIILRVMTTFENQEFSTHLFPGYCQYEMRITELLLELTRILAPSELPDLLSRIVLSKSCEVACAGLNFVVQVITKTPLALPNEEDILGERHPFADVQRALQESSSLSESISSLLLLPYEQIHPDVRFRCFELLQHMPLIMMHLLGKLETTHAVENSDKKKNAITILHWLLNKLGEETERTGPAIISSFSIFFSYIDKDFCLDSRDFLNMCVTLEYMSDPGSPVEIRFSIACLISSSKTSELLLQLGDQNEEKSLGICHLWTAALQLLDDDEIEVREQVAILVHRLSKCQNVQKTFMSECTKDLYSSHHILVSTFVHIVAKDAGLFAAVTLSIWILQYCDLKGLDEDEDQLFARSEVNTHMEPILLAEAASTALRNLIANEPTLGTRPLPPALLEWLLVRCWENSNLASCKEGVTLAELAAVAERRIEMAVELEYQSTGQVVRPSETCEMEVKKSCAWQVATLRNSPGLRAASLRVRLLHAALTASS